MTTGEIITNILIGYTLLPFVFALMVEEACRESEYPRWYVAVLPYWVLSVPAAWLGWVVAFVGIAMLQLPV